MLLSIGTSGRRLPTTVCSSISGRVEIEVVDNIGYVGYASFTLIDRGLFQVRHCDVLGCVAGCTSH